MATQPLSFGSLLPMDGHFESLANKVVADGASTPPVKGSPNNHHAQALPSSPRWGKEEQAAFRAAACLLGKDVPRIAALCSKQAQEIETIWKEVFRGTQSYRAVKLLSPQQRGELATSLVMQLAGIDIGVMGDAEDNKMDAVDNGKAAQLQDLASHLASQEVSVGEVVDALLPIVGASTVLQTVMSLVKGSSWGVALMTPGNRELAGWQQASEDDDIDLYSGPRDMTDVSDDDMIDAATVLSPPDSHLTTGLGAADASVSLAINPSGLMPIKQLQRQQQPTPPTPQQQAQPDSLPPHSRLPPMPPSGPTVQQQTGSTPTQGHTPQHTPSHSRKSSRPSTPQRASPSDGLVNKICTNCGTSSTPLWRKEGGVLMCNACGIYFKTHGFHRPVDLIRAATSSRRESGGGSGSAASGKGGGGHTPPGSMMGGGGAGMETPAASSEPGLSAPGGGVAHGDTATSPPHRRRRSSPSPLRFQNSVGTVEGTSSAARFSGGGGSMFNSDNEDALSDGPGHSGSQGGGSTRRSGRRRAPRQSWPEYEEIMAAGVNGSQQPGLPTQAALQQQQQQLTSRRASSGTGPVGSVLYAGGSSHGKRSRFGEQFHQGGAGGSAAPGGGYHSAPGTHYSGSEYGDDVEAMSRLADVGAAMEGGATSQSRGDVLMQAPNLGREFSFGMPGLDGHGEGHPRSQDTRQGPHGLVCITPRLPSGPIDEAVRRAADEAEAVAAAAGGHGLAPGHAPDGSPTTSTGVGVGSQPRLSMDSERTGGRVSISSVVNDAHHLHLLRGARGLLGGAAVPTTSQQDSGMDVETPDLTIEHDPADVAAVLLGLKHALVLKEDSAPVYHMPTSSHRGGARSQNNSGRSSPMRGRRGGPASALAAAAAAADRGYWSGPDDGPSHRPTKRSRSPMARLLHAEGGGSGSARASPANSGGGGAAAGGGGAGTVDGRPLMVCANCGTSRTPLWRKDKETGESMCNACGIYKQTHGYARPHKGLERDASPSVSGATGGAASGPIAIPRGRARPTGSITSGGAVTGGGGTPPGTSNLGAGSQRRASTGFLAGGRPPLPPPALASRSSQPLPAMQSLQQFPSGTSEQATAPAGQATAAAPSAEPLRPQGQGTPAGGMPVPPPAPGIPWTAHAQGMPGMAIMGSAPWPFYQLQMANMNMAAAHHHSQSQHQQLQHPPAGDRIGSNSSAPGPNPSSSTGTTTSEEQGQATRRQVAPKPQLHSQNAPGEMQVSEQSAPSPTATSSQQNAQAANPSSPGNSGAQLSISQVQHQQLRPQASGTGPMPPPALGMPSDPNQALAAAASLAATLQQHQALAAAAAAANARGRGGQPGDGPAQGTPAAGHPAGWPPGTPPNPFFTSVYSAQHHLQAHPQMHFAGPVQGTVTGMPRPAGSMAHPGHMNGQMSGVVNGAIGSMPPRNPFGNPPPWSMAMAAGHPMQHIHADSQP